MTPAMPTTEPAAPTESERVYTVIRSIPPGRVASYGQIARLAGLPRRARWVGRLLAQLPEGSTLPWFRVINASGRITFAPGSARFARQRRALVADGIEVSPSGRVALDRFGWLAETR